MTAIAVFGPAACGKTTMKDEIARERGCKHIVDDADELHIKRAKPDTLYLTNLSGEEVQSANPRVRRYAFAYLRIRRP